MQDPKPVPQASKKKMNKKTGQAKAASARLEGFVDWTNPRVNESAKEEEAEMSGLVSGFSVRMRKRATSAQGETTLGTEVLGRKCPKLSGSDEKAQKSPVIINVDSPDQAFDA